MNHGNLIVEQDIAYLEYVSTFLSIVKGKTVLELASFGGWHTQLMINLGAKSITCVEPNLFNNDIYKDKSVTLYNCTANDYYSKIADPTVDIVTCLGLLYHLHSPLHLIEQIINKSKPKYLILETYFNPKICIGNEEYDFLGNARADNEILNPIKANLSLPIEEIIRCVETTNYKVVRVENNIGRFQTISKRSISIASFEKQEYE